MESDTEKKSLEYLESAPLSKLMSDAERARYDKKIAKENAGYYERKFERHKNMQKVKVDKRKAVMRKVKVAAFTTAMAALLLFGKKCHERTVGKEYIIGQVGTSFDGTDGGYYVDSMSGKIYHKDSTSVRPYEVPFKEAFEYDFGIIHDAGFGGNEAYIYLVDKYGDEYINEFMTVQPDKVSDVIQEAYHEAMIEKISSKGHGM